MSGSALRSCFLGRSSGLRRSRGPGRVLGALGLCLLAVPAPAEARAPDICGTIAEEIERTQDLPPGLLHAVALAESGRWQPAEGLSRAWPWTVRSGPDSFYLPSKSAALAKVRQLRAAGRTNIDVGCMQINLGYHGDVFASLEEAMDPASNIAYGARFLKALHLQTRSWAGAVGRYHSGDHDRGHAYRARVFRLWQELRRWQGREAPTITEAAFLGDRLRRLVGGSTVGNSPAAPTARLMAPTSGEAPARRGGGKVLRGR